MSNNPGWGAQQAGQKGIQADHQHVPQETARERRARRQAVAQGQVEPVSRQVWDEQRRIWVRS